jgi:hypothetical protein
VHGLQLLKLAQELNGATGVMAIALKRGHQVPLAGDVTLTLRDMALGLSQIHLQQLPVHGAD